MTSGSWKALIGLFVLTMGTSIITPLLPLYRSHFGISNATATALFVTYTITVVPTMLVAGNLADRVGRKHLLIPALAVMTVASLVFALAESVPMLFAGRVLQGLAIGGFLGVGTAFVVDHARPAQRALAAALAGVAFRLGFGLGPGLGGLIAQYGPNPRHTPFWGHIAVMFVGIVAVATAAETLKDAPSRGTPFRIRIGVPKGQVLGFMTFIVPAAFTMSFMEGTVLSVVPLFMVEDLGVTNIALVGAVGFLVLGLGGITPFLVRNVDPRRAILVALPISAALTFLVVGSAATNSALMVVVAAAAIGFVNGALLYGGTVIAGIMTPLHERGKLMSVLYMSAYAGTIPTVALGALSDRVGLTTTLLVFSICAAALAAFVVLVGSRLFPEVVPYQDAEHA
ncbi:MAG: MFS transporter [Thermoleophilia bacterium]